MHIIYLNITQQSCNEYSYYLRGNLYLKTIMIKKRKFIIINIIGNLNMHYNIF